MDCSSSVSPEKPPGNSPALRTKLRMLKALTSAAKAIIASRRASRRNSSFKAFFLRFTSIMQDFSE